MNNKIGSTIVLKDLALGLLFPIYWVQYRSRCSKQNVFKIKIINTVDGINEILLMEVSPVEGRVILPNGISSFIKDELLNRAIKYSEKNDEEDVIDFDEYDEDE